MWDVNKLSGEIQVVRGGIDINVGIGELPDIQFILLRQKLTSELEITKLGALTKAKRRICSLCRLSSNAKRLRTPVVRVPWPVFPPKMTWLFARARVETSKTVYIRARNTMNSEAMLVHRDGGPGYRRTGTEDGMY